MPDRSIVHGCANLIVRMRWPIVLAWLAGAGALALLVPPADPSADKRTTFLPEDMPSRVAARTLARHFPRNSGLSAAVVVFERRAKLTRTDRKVIGAIAARLRRPVAGLTTGRDLEDVHVRSPWSIPHSPMVSPVSDRGQAALIVVNIPANFVTTRCSLLVRHVRKVVADQPLPDGLSASVTGSAAFGRDYGLAAERSHTRTLYVTLTAVVVILLLVYRAPVAALIPLGAVSLAAVTAVSLLAAAGHAGFSTGNAERIFLIVLLYGAGVDYSLLLISRCREFLEQGLSPRRATTAGLAASLPAILASAGTDTAGLLTLCFARFGIFRTTGLTVGLALVIAMLSAVTLVPALVSLAGAKLYWPGRRSPRGRQRWRIWPRIAVAVTSRAGLILLATVALLIAPAVQGTRLTWRYDTLTSLGDRYGAVRGAKMVKRHWPVGEMGPISILFEADRPVNAKQWERASTLITSGLQKVPGVENVRSLTQPLGKRPPKSAAKRLFKRLFGDPLGRVTRAESRREYLSRDETACRFVVVLAKPGLSLEAMSICDEVRSAASAAADEAKLDAQMHLAGITPEVIDIREVTHGDFYLIAALVLSVIFVMVFVLLRDVILSAFMVASTILSYLATLGLCYWFFAAFSDTAGLDWKVEVFLFVVMVAVGQDYNIFLAARLAQEASIRPAGPATRRAIIHTGPVISSCGVIMAATLGSLMVGDLVLMVQLGFALALGMLIDTFVIRPLLLPAFAVLTGRTGKGSHIRA